MERGALQEGTTMQLFELEAWLGDDHGLNEDELTELLDQANDIEDRYPDADDQPERDAALSAAYRLMTEPVENVLADYGKQRTDARAAASAASAALQQAARTVVAEGKLSEAGFARVATVDRMSVRKWIDKR
jgi:multidrug efflux pump subunit AcrA (membrane-fusion protein)